MASERFQLRIDRLLDQVENAAGMREWHEVRQLAEDVLAVDPANGDAQSYIAAANRNLSSTGSPVGEASTPAELTGSHIECANHPGREPVGACVSCGRLVCPECRMMAQGKVSCTRCVAVSKLRAGQLATGKKFAGLTFGVFFGSFILIIIYATLVDTPEDSGVALLVLHLLGIILLGCCMFIVPFVPIYYGWKHKKAFDLRIEAVLSGEVPVTIAPVGPSRDNATSRPRNGPGIGSR